MHLAVDGGGVDIAIGSGAALAADMLVTGGDDGDLGDGVGVVHHPHVDDAALPHGILMCRHTDVAEDEDGLVADGGDGVAALSVGGGIDLLTAHGDAGAHEGLAIAIGDLSRHRLLCHGREGEEEEDRQQCQTEEAMEMGCNAQRLALRNVIGMLGDKGNISCFGDPVHR